MCGSNQSKSKLTEKDLKQIWNKDKFSSFTETAYQRNPIQQLLHSNPPSSFIKSSTPQFNLKTQKTLIFPKPKKFLNHLPKSSQSDPTILSSYTIDKLTVYKRESCSKIGSPEYTAYKEICSIFENYKLNRPKGDSEPLFITSKSEESRDIKTQISRNFSEKKNDENSQSKAESTSIQPNSYQKDLERTANKDDERVDQARMVENRLACRFAKCEGRHSFSEGSVFSRVIKSTKCIFTDLQWVGYLVQHPNPYDDDEFRELILLSNLLNTGLTGQGPVTPTLLGS